MAKPIMETLPRVFVSLTKKETIRIMLVDDESGFLKIAKECLELQGQLKVDTALSAQEAMEKMKTKKFDVVVSDYMMPEKNGLQFLQELRDTKNNIPFIIFTGEGGEEVAVKALNFGADRYFNKFGDPGKVYDELSRSIRQVVESRRVEEALRERRNYLDTVLNSIFVGVVVIDEKTHKIMDANSKALEMIGASREHVVGRVCHSFICPAEMGKCPITDFRQEVDKSERVLLTANGKRVPILKTVATTIWRDHKCLVESFTDITEYKQAEQATRESQEKFKRFFMDNPEAAVYVGSDLCILDVNPRFGELFGYSLDEIKGKRLLDLIVPEGRKKEGEMLDKEATKAYTYNDTVRKRKDGSLVPVSISAAPVIVEGKPLGYIGLYREITERKNYEERLSALNIHSQKLNMADSTKEIYQLTLDAVEKTLGFEIAFFMVVDKGMLRVVDHRGYPKSFSKELPLDGTKKGVSVKVVRTGRSINVPDAEKEEDWVEFWPGIRSGLDVPVKIGRKVLGVIGVDSKKVAAFNGKDQKLLEILALHAATAMSNLEHAKNLEMQTREILESREKFKQLFMDNPEAAVYVDPDFHVFDVNPRFEELFGYSLKEVKGKHINELVVPKDKLEEAETIDRRALRGRSYDETVRKKKDGSLVPVSISVAPITVEGKIIGSVGLYRDITERRRYEERLSALNTYSHNLNLAKNMKEIYRLTLDVMQKVLGFEYADLMMIDRNMLCIVDQRGYPKPFPLELPLNGSKGGIGIKVVRTGNSVIVPDVRKDKDFVKGLPGVLSELTVPIVVGHKILGVLNVESKRLDAFDEKDQKLLEILALHAATAISNWEYAKNLETYAREVRESQQKFERLFMGNPEAADYLDPTFHIIDVNPRFEELFGYSIKEVKGKHINELIVPRDKLEEAETIDKKSGEGMICCDTVRKRKDGSLVQVSISAAPMIVDGKLLGTVGLYKDISQLKRTEKELRDTLTVLKLMNEKLRVVGGLTRHDVRNKLSAVVMNIYLAKNRLVESNKAFEPLNEAESIIRGVERIFDFAKTYEMLGVEELVYMDVEKTVREAVSLFSNLKGVKVANKCSGLTVWADSLLRQIFYNLIDNSLKYGEKVKKIKVYYEEIGNNQLKLVYEDDGVGIPKAEKKNLFKEGYGKGTGYGLYLIRKICEVYGWTIQETGKHGKGAQFTMIIPKINESEKTNYELN